MDLYLKNRNAIPVFKALSNTTRIDIINLLAEGKKNITQLSNELNTSKAMITRHIKQLEDAELIQTEVIPAKSGTQKICSLKIEKIEVNFPKKLYPDYKFREIEIPVGHYTDYTVEPTCGLASNEGFIGEVDNPKFFMDRNRMDAELLWFTRGFVEYKIPNIMEKEDTIEMIEISLEVASEFPVSNDNWPSDISFHLNDNLLGTWTSPGNYSDTEGINNPEWWPRKNSQYGLLKNIRIFDNETLMDSEKLSDIKLKDINLNNSLFSLRISVDQNAENIGGLTLFGKEFGNHPQNIQFKIYYS